MARVFRGGEQIEGGGKWGPVVRQKKVSKRRGLFGGDEVDGAADTAIAGGAGMALASYGCKGRKVCKRGAWPLTEVRCATRGRPCPKGFSSPKRV